MKIDGQRFHIYNIEGHRVGEMYVKDQKEVWPLGVKGWMHALDCSVEPYLELSLKEQLSIAEHARKQVIVVEIKEESAPETEVSESTADATPDATSDATSDAAE